MIVTRTTPEGRGERLSLSAGPHRLVFNDPDYQPPKRTVNLQTRHEAAN
jgi:hypothetical protein